MNDSPPCCQMRTLFNGLNLYQSRIRARKRLESTSSCSPEGWPIAKNAVGVSFSRHDGRTPQSGVRPGPSQAGAA